MRNSFSVGGVLGRSLTVLISNFIPFFLLAALLNLPLFLWQFLTMPQDAAAVRGMSRQEILDLQGHLETVALIAIPIRLILTQLVAATLIYGVVQQLRGRRAPMGASIEMGLRRLLPVLGVSLAIGIVLALVAVVMAVIIVPVFGFILSGMSPEMQAIVVLLLIALGVAPLLCMWWVAVPAAVIERGGIGHALNRSATLTRDRRMAIFGIFFVLGLIGGVVGALVPAVLEPRFRTAVVVDFVVAIPVSLWQASAQGVAYHDLRAEKEGVDVEQLAAVFE